MTQNTTAKMSAPTVRVLYEIAGVLESADASEQRINHVLRLLQGMVPYDRCALLVAPTLGPRLFIARPEDADPDQPDQANVRRTAERLFDLVDDDADTDIANLWPGAAASAPWKCHLAVPLIGVDRLVGVLVVGRDELEAYDDDDLSLLSIVSAQLGAYWTALEKRELDQSEARSREQAALALSEKRFAELEELDRLKDEFITIASHDLKSPLTSITGYAQMLRRLMGMPTLDTGAVLDGLGVIVNQVAAMTRLLDDLLNASLIQARALELDITSCDLLECLDTILRRLNPEERGRVGLEVPDMPLVGDWDQRRIEDALGNLLRNALKYSPENERVTVVLEQRPGEVEVAVIDRGMGIAPEELSQIFQRFHRTRQGRASGLPGIGLGLYICHGIITRHGGRIWAESPGEGKGATFRFILPVESRRTEI